MTATVERLTDVPVKDKWTDMNFDTVKNGFDTTIKTAKEKIMNLPDNYMLQSV